MGNHQNVMEQQLSSPAGPAEADDELLLHYREGGALYKFWASPMSVASAILLGWERSGHPGQLHYGWDLESGLTLDQAIARPLGVVNDNLRLPNESLVLELGCGIGGSALEFSRQAPGSKLVGISIVSRQLEVAKRRCARRKLANTAFTTANYLSLPFGHETFEGCFAIESLCHCPAERKKELLDGIYAVTKPGRRLVILDGYKNPAVKRDDLAGDYEAMKRGWAFPDLVTAEELSAAAKQAGFICESETDVTDRILSASARIAAIASPLLRLSSAVVAAIQHRRLSMVRRLLGKSTGLLTSFSIPMLQAAVSQKNLFGEGYLTYHMHVFSKPGGPNER